MQNYLILSVLPFLSDDFALGSRGVMTVYENYDVIAFKSCIQIFTVCNTPSEYTIASVITPVGLIIRS